MAGLPSHSEPQPTVGGGVPGSCARNHCAARSTPGEALAVGSLGWRWLMQHVLQDQDCPYPEAAFPRILGARNAQTGDWEHRYLGGNHHFRFLVNVVFILNPGGYMEKLFLKEQLYGNV